MAIGFASQPVQPIPIQLQQYQLPVDHIVQGLANAQNIQDTYTNALTQVGDPMYNIATLSDQDQALLQQKQQDYETRLEEWSKQDLRKQGRDIQKYVRGIVRDPELQALTRRQARYQDLLKQRDELIGKEKWRDWMMYPVQKALSDYETSGEFDPNFTLPSLAPFRDVDEELFTRAKEMDPKITERINQDIQNLGITGVEKITDLGSTLESYNSAVQKLVNSMSTADLEAISMEAQYYGYTPEELAYQKAEAALQPFIKYNQELNNVQLDGSNSVLGGTGPISGVLPGTAQDAELISDILEDYYKWKKPDMVQAIGAGEAFRIIRDAFEADFRTGESGEEVSFNNIAKLTGEELANGLEEFSPKFKEAYNVLAKKIKNSYGLKEDIYSEKVRNAVLQYTENFEENQLITPTRLITTEKAAKEYEDQLSRHGGTLPFLLKDMGSLGITGVFNLDELAENLEITPSDINVVYLGKHGPDSYAKEIAEKAGYENMLPGQNPFVTPFEVRLEWTDSSGEKGFTTALAGNMAATQKEAVAHDIEFSTRTQPGLYVDANEIPALAAIPGLAIPGLQVKRNTQGFNPSSQTTGYTLKVNPNHYNLPENTFTPDGEIEAESLEELTGVVFDILKNTLKQNNEIVAESVRQDFIDKNGREPSTTELQEEVSQQRDVLISKFPGLRNIIEEGSRFAYNKEKIDLARPAKTGISPLPDYTKVLDTPTAKLFREITDGKSYFLGAKGIGNYTQNKQGDSILTSVDSIDCSGAVCQVKNRQGFDYSLVGTNAAMFANLAEERNIPIENAQDGDLILMDSDANGNIDHIGFIVVDNDGNKFIAESSSSYNGATTIPFDLRISDLQLATGNKLSYEIVRDSKK